MSSAQEKRREAAIEDAKADFEADLAPYQAILHDLRNKLKKSQEDGDEAKSVGLISEIEKAERRLDEVAEGTLYYKLVMKD